MADIVFVIDNAIWQAAKSRTDGLVTQKMVCVCVHQSKLLKSDYEACFHTPYEHNIIHDARAPENCFKLFHM